MAQTIKLVYSNYKYLALSIAIFVPMVIGLLILSEYIFLEPYVVSHLPSGTEFGFLLIITISALSALVIPMNIYRINIIQTSKQKWEEVFLVHLLGLLPVHVAVVLLDLQ